MPTGIVLVGMSGAGKSALAPAIQNELSTQCHDYDTVEIDQQIADALNLGDVREVGTWMGTPETEGYATKQNQYLEHETQFTREAIERACAGENLIIDTTGSLPHIDQKVHTLIQESSQICVVYLKTPKNFVDKKIAQFIADVEAGIPKPIVWGDFCLYMSGNADCQNNQHIESCYPALVEFRNKIYSQLADITVVPYQDKSFNALRAACPNWVKNSPLIKTIQKTLGLDQPTYKPKEVILSEIFQDMYTFQTRVDQVISEAGEVA